MKRLSVCFQFDEFVQTLHVDPHSPLFRLVTDGQPPLRQCLHPEACSKELTLPPYYARFHDLRKEYVRAYTLRAVAQTPGQAPPPPPPDHPTTLHDMLTYLGIPPYDGSNFYAAEAKDMASVIQRIITDGFRLELPETIDLVLETGICSKDDEIDNNCIVRARGLPWQSSDQDIAKFFRGLNVAKGGVALCLSPQGRRNGEALVRFISQEHRDMALKRHKHHIGPRYIEVYRASGEDFLSVAGGATCEAAAFLSRGAQVIVRMRGLPYDATPQQVLEFFTTGDEPVQVLDGSEGVLFVRRADGRATGDAFVLFSKEEDSPKALSRHRKLIGSRYIELFRSTTAEVQQVLNRSLETRSSSSSTPAAAPQEGLLPVALVPQHVITSGTAKDCVRLRGLPYEAQDTIRDEFARSGPGLTGPLQLETRSSSSSTPAAAPQEGLLPVALVPQHVITSGTAKDCVRLRGLPYEAQRQEGLLPVALVPQHVITSGTAKDCVRLRGLPYEAQRQEGLLPVALVPQHVITSGTAKDCVRLRGLPYEAQVSRLLTGAKFLYMALSSGTSGGGSGRRGLLPVALVPQHVITSGTAKDCVRLRGLPYEAQVEHILTFLDEFAKNIVVQGVHMVYNAQGHPSGEAFIQMDSETSAFLCAQQKHNRYMTFGKKQRYIEVFQCSGDDMNLVLTGGVAPVASPKVLSPGTLPPPAPAAPRILAQHIAHQNLLARQQENLLLASLRPQLPVGYPYLPYSVRPSTPQPYQMLQQAQIMPTKRSYERAFTQTAEATPAKRPYTVQQQMAPALSLPMFSYASNTPIFSYANSAPMLTYASALPGGMPAGMAGGMPTGLPAGYGSALTAALPPTMSSPFPTLSMFPTYPYYPGV
ncbi:unnamed protein product [Plutella xylostella]|uniref:(diamondback moth) hypothetical protein n=1 Tax=Plutella xylostella TaxID=51655 RepID=A0A8S4FA59_PLUXY|nr:unnamed protein product [Plutella xylostella]